MLTWFSEKAKWLIYIFIAFIGISLLSMDFMSLQWSNEPAAATWGKSSVQISEFDARYKQVTEGRNELTESQKAELRQQLIESVVDQRLLSKASEDLKAIVSHDELVAHLQDYFNQPPEKWMSPEVAKQFYGPDGKLDRDKYKKALEQAIAKGDAGVANIENEIRQKLAQARLLALVSAGFHPTDLESQFIAQTQVSQMNLALIAAPLDSFNAPLPAAAAANANPVPTDMAVFEYVAIPNVPSKLDEQLAKDNIDTAYAQLNAGVSFAEVSEQFNEDDAARTDSGSLGDYATLDRWDSKFAQNVANLDSGKISAPFRTQFGWHVVLCEGKKTDSTGKILYKLRHVLTKVTIGTDTERDTRDLLNSIRHAVTEGSSLADAAKAKGLKAETSRWTGIDSIPGIGYLTGLHAYANPMHQVSGIVALWNSSGVKSKDREAISPVLKGDRFFAIAIAKDYRFQGDTSAGATAAIQQNTQQAQAKAKAAMDYLNQQRALLATISPDSLVKASNGKIVVLKHGENWDTTQKILIPEDGRVLGVKFSPEFMALSKTDSGTWSTAFAGDKMAFLAKPLSKKPMDANTLWQRKMSEYWALGGSPRSAAALKDWTRLLRHQEKARFFVEQLQRGVED